MNKKIRNVLSVTALAAMMPFAVNAAEMTGDVTTEATGYSENITLTGDVTSIDNAIKNGTVNVGGANVGKDITINLNGHTLTTGNKALLDSTNTGTIVIENGTVDCGTGATCIDAAATGKVVLSGVTVKGSVSAANAEIKNSEITGTITSTKVNTSGTIKSKDFSNLAKMTAGTFVYNGSPLSGQAIELPNNVNLVLAKDVTGTITFAKDKFDTISRVSLEDSKNYQMKLTSGSISSDSREFTISKVKADLTEYKKIKDAYNKLTTAEKEAVEKLLPELFSWTEFNTGLTETSDQEIVNWYVNALNAAMGGKTITDEKPEVKDPSNETQAPAGDETISKNPQTSDSVYSIAGLGLAGISALGVATKKRFN